MRRKEEEVHLFYGTAGHHSAARDSDSDVGSRTQPCFGMAELPKVERSDSRDGVQEKRMVSLQQENTLVRLALPPEPRVQFGLRLLGVTRYPCATCLRAQWIPFKVAVEKVHRPERLTRIFRS